MCNPEIIETMRTLIEKLSTHKDDLRLRFTDVEESFHEGNLDDDVLSFMNQAIHRLEADTAEFEKLLEE